MDRDLEPVPFGRDERPDEAEQAAPPVPVRRRPVARLTAGALALAAVIGVVAVVAGSQPPTAEERLADIRSFVADADTAHFAATMEERTGPPGESGLGSEEITRSRLDGDLAFPGKSHWHLDDGDYDDETIVLLDGVYSRSTGLYDSASLGDGEEADLDDLPWTWFPLAQMEQTRSASLGEASFLGEANAVAPILSWLTPDELGKVLARLEQPERVDGDTIRTRLSLAELFGDEDLVRDLEGGLVVELTSAGDGRLDRLVWTITMKARPGSELADEDSEYGAFYDFWLKSDVRFSGWGEPVEIAAPDLADVDPTPGVDEEALAKVDFVTMSVPRALPAGFELVTNFVQTPSEAADMEEVSGEPAFCPSVYLSYADASEMQQMQAIAAGPMPLSLSLSFSPASCDDGDSGMLFSLNLDEEEPKEEPYQAGPHRGTIVRETNPAWPFLGIELTVGDTRLSVASNLPEADVTALLADLVPFDLATAPIYRSVPPAG